MVESLGLTVIREIGQTTLHSQTWRVVASLYCTPSLDLKLAFKP